jgi:hypothetical protein
MKKKQKRNFGIGWRNWKRALLGGGAGICGVVFANVFDIAKNAKDVGKEARGGRPRLPTKGPGPTKTTFPFSTLPRGLSFRPAALFVMANHQNIEQILIILGPVATSSPTHSIERNGGSSGNCRGRGRCGKQGGVGLVGLFAIFQSKDDEKEAGWDIGSHPGKSGGCFRPVLLADVFDEPSVEEEGNMVKKKGLPFANPSRVATGQ